jgi:endoglucanase
MRKHILLFSFLLWTCLSFSQTPWLHTEGNKIKDPLGNEVRIRGLDVQDIKLQKLDATVGLYGLINRLTDSTDASASSPGWFPKAIRFTINPGITDFEEYYTTVLRPAVDSATKRGQYIILDNHFIADIFGNIEYTNNFWTYMAPRFRNESNVMFEVYNEPINMNMSWGQFKPYMQDWVDLIRKYAPHNLILAGSPMWDQRMGDAATDPLVGENIVYVAHIYPIHWNTAWNRAEVERAASAVPVILSEWGFRKGASVSDLRGTVDVYGTQIMQWADTYGLSWTAWCADNDWEPAMFTRNWQLRIGNDEMGGFVKDKLYEKRNDHQPADVKCLAPYLGESQTLCGKTSLVLNTFFSKNSKSFKWYHDGVELSGETDSALTITQKGKYKVEVDTNGCKMAHTISVIDTLFPVTLPLNQVLEDSLELVAAEAGAPFTFEWFKNEVLIPTATSRSLKVKDTCTTEFKVVVSYVGCGSSSDEFTSLCKRELYLGYPIPVPGKVEAEYFDGQNLPNVSFYDIDNGNSGGALRSGGVDVEATSDAGGGYNVGWTETGEWMEYSIDVQDPGVCGITFRVASNATAGGGSLRLFLNGVDKTGIVAMPYTAGWQTYQNVVVNGIEFAATDTVIRIYISQKGFNINYFNIQKGFVNGISDDEMKRAFALFPNPANEELNIAGIENPEWKVVNAQGTMVQSGQGATINTTELPAGYYSLLINGIAKSFVKR